MAFVAFGVNHKTAPLSLREKIAQHPDVQQNYLQQLLQIQHVSEAMLLSTCNRTELYCETNRTDILLPWLANIHKLNPSLLEQYFYCYEGDDAIRHVLKVANGIDSMMIGEPQILGQMKQAYADAEQWGMAKRQLRLVLPFIFSASKRIRQQSGIGNNPISVASAATRLIGQLFPDYSKLHAFIIGSGETASLVTKYLQQQGVTSFTVASRTLEHAHYLAQKLNAHSLTITDIPLHLPKADVIISATACPLPFIKKPMVAQALNTRQHQPMFFLDLAVPRDIEPDVAELDNVHLFNIDDLHISIEKSMLERRTAALHAEELIEHELANYMRWYRSLRANPVICDYRSQMQELAQAELKRATQKLSSGQCQYSVLNEFCERLVNKLTHAPTVGLRQAAVGNQDEFMLLSQYLLNTSMDTRAHEEIA